MHRAAAIMMAQEVEKSRDQSVKEAETVSNSYIAIAIDTSSAVSS